MTDAPQFLDLEDGARLAYHATEGQKDGRPGVMFCGGFMSDMTGGKAVFLEEHCKAAGLSFLRFDYTGHGQSSGDFEDGSIGDWAGNALAAFDRLTSGPMVLIGSSMGGWTSLLVSLQRRERIAGLIGIAPAPDFTEDLIWGSMPRTQREDLEKAGRVEQPSEYSDSPYIITRKLIEDGRRHLLLRDPIALDCPVRLLHGLEDAAVPWETSLRIAEKLTSRQVEIQLVKGGDHRLSEERDLARLGETLDALLAGIASGKLASA